MGRPLTSRASRRRHAPRADRDSAGDGAFDAASGGRGRAYLVGAIRSGQLEADVEAHLAELSALADTAGFDEAGRAMLPVRAIHPATFIGQGQAKDVGLMAQGLGAAVVVVDEDLSPAQVRNLEKITDLTIVDRAGLIIDIFAQHARSKEARTQVELARLQYLLPRLAGRWSHLSRQVGGGPGGTKGEGEKQIELDRRMIRRRIDHLRRQLARVDRARRIRRSSRREIREVALVGYTNVGKSSLFNRLAGASTRVENQLFATLDPTVRRVEAGRRGAYLVKDTVGFIRKLPHDLVASFRSTFQEADDADLLLLVVDASHPAFEEQLETAETVLRESGLEDIPRVLVLNKIDRLDEPARLGLASRYPRAHLVSAVSGHGLDHLEEALADRLLGRERTGTLEIPSHRGDVVEMARRLAEVERCEQENGMIQLTLRATGSTFARLERRLDGKIAGRDG